MNKKRRKSIIELSRMSVMFIALYFVLTNGANIYAIIVILIIPNLLAQIAHSMFDQKQTKRSNKKKRKKSTNKANVAVPTTRLSSDYEIMKMPLDKMSGAEFERLCYLYYKAKGYKPKETGKGADGGVDLLIYQRYHNDYEAVQVKHYQNSGNNITVKEIRELNSSKQNHGCVLARFITTSTYSKDALKQADQWRIKTHDREWVKNKIETWREKELQKTKYA
ncbi:restriction system protein [Pelagirhabdus alkalitolerans]|uniref:Restriction system protein n=1 Tax=Pelagirhabdus alkalitolerans TaxID=1612202 RepID=A0A1G6HM75_9BACI|nr:restriction endonuclease [Pelagirhabdus alkalitolerans]SDB95407.1 restriction system protein [Pelagirhabdus alkalitolerans]